MTGDDEAPDSLDPIVASDPTPPVARTWGIAQAAAAGAIGGLISGLVGGIPYVRAYFDEPIPWRRLGTAFVLFVMATGATYAAGARGGIALFERRPAWWKILGGAIAGCALVGPAPGVIGATYFGSESYPFMGTASLAFAPFIGAFVTSASVAIADGRTAKEPAWRAALFGATIATTLFGAIGMLMVVSIPDNVMLAWFRSDAAAGEALSLVQLAKVGAKAGIFLGLLLGAHIGTTIALARRMRLTTTTSRSKARRPSRC